MNETITVITTFINGVGFPIAMCAYLAYFMNKTLKELTEVLHENTIAIKEIYVLVEKRIEGVDNDEN